MTAAATVPTLPSNKLFSTLKSSIVVSEDGTAATPGGAEIPAFDPASRRVFSASNAGIQVIDFTNPSAPVRLAPIDPTTLGITSKDISHVIVKNGVLAASVVGHPDKTLPGTVLFLNPANGTLLGSVVVGANPDQLVFTPDGTKVLVANEAEIALPSTNPAGGDPEGSISIIDVSGGFAAPTVQTARFTAWNGQEYSLLADGVRIFPGKTAAQDLEPEYIAISPDGTKAMVTIQEASSLAVLDIATATFTNLVPTGLKNYSRGTYDFSDRDGPSNALAIELKSGLPAFGTPMPDAISSYQAAGQTYYITSNEGDDRNDFLTTPEFTTVNALSYDLDDATFPTEGTPGGAGSAGVPGTGLKGNDELGRLTVCNITGLRGDLDGDGDVDRILSYGARGFSIHDNTGKRIFESGDLLDRIIAQYFPTLWDDSRSDNKGAEAEGVAISSLFGRTYAFIGLERAHAVAVFDVTNPMAVEFTTMIHRRGDLNPESMVIIPAADSPTGNPLLLVANEVSYSLTAYELAASSAPLALQLLHYYGESGLLGIQTAPLMGAMIDKFDDLHPTVVLGEGDSFIPGPWLIAGADPSLNAVPGIGATALARPDIAIMNAFNTTASALGNHEFDLGSPVLQGAIAAAGAWPGAQFPLITANLNFASDSSLRTLADSSSGGSGGAAASGTQVPNIYRGEEVSGIKGRIAPYAVHTVQGQRIGFVGATTWELLTKSSPNGTRPLNDNSSATSELQEVATAVQGAVDLLKVRGINKIIVLDQLDALQRNKDLAPLLTGVDVMVAGGGHERMGDANDRAVGFNGHDADFISDAYPIVTAGADGKPVLIVTTDTEYSYLGRLVVNFDAAGEIVTGDLNAVVNGAYAAAPATVEAVYNNGQTAAQIVAASPMATKVKAIVDALNTVIVNKDGTIHGHTKVYLEGDRVFGRAQEVNLGNLTADANAVKARNALGLPATAAVVSLKNGGGLRASIGSVSANGAKLPPAANLITNKPKGAISQLDTENALRFDNKLIVFDTNPAGLMAILEFTAGLPSGNGGFPQVGNIRFSFDKTATPKVRNVVLMNDAGALVAKIAENGVVLPSAPAFIQVVTLNFMANGGDSYPIKYLDPAASPPNQIPNPNTSNFRFILTNGTLSAELARNLDFTAAANVPATALGEQKAFADYITARHGSPVSAYDVADTPIGQDTRIQQLPTRSLDTVVFTEIELWRLMFFGSPNGDGLRANTADFDGDGESNLMEFAFGTLPGDNTSGTAELIYTGTFAGDGTIDLRGQPITAVQPIPNNVDFRYLYIRRKNYEAAGLVYTPQFSVDLQTWQASSATSTILADDGVYQIVSVPYTRFIDGRKARFARLLVTAP
ncbi:MAG: choice-of-anchor I family protein [Verrucomicrobiales bacterium]